MKVQSHADISQFKSRQHGVQLDLAQTSIEILNDIGLPAAFLGSDGQIVYANALFMEADQYFSRSPSGQLAIKGDESVAEVFAQALESSRTQTVSIPIPANGNKHAAVVRLMPIRLNAASIFSMCCTVLIVTTVDTTAGVPSLELTASLFNLTPAEARVATALASGLSLDEIAISLDITIGAVRTYLNRVFRKTGTSQQSKLVSLLKSF